MNSVMISPGPMGKRARPISALEAEKMVKAGKAKFLRNKLYEEIVSATPKDKPDKGGRPDIPPGQDENPGNRPEIPPGQESEEIGEPDDEGDDTGTTQQKTVRVPDSGDSAEYSRKVMKPERKGEKRK